ncbi:MAG: ImmA/IrrE family metallo-endopeptidase [Prevotellaceae bacterium]|jgi:Zn-dependent peptidase ImmA (M78 family)|nr:ImmA/IrrE family metallo-endopeptidase [Prevotellaceae bacterium]
MPLYVDVKPELLQWAINRSQLSASGSGLPCEQWIRQDKKPTLRQLEEFAKKFMVPLGYLFLSTPPEETFPLADFRTLDNASPSRPSPNLLDTIYSMQEKQEWMRERQLQDEVPPLSFIGSLKKTSDEKQDAEDIRKQLNLTEQWTNNSTEDNHLKVLRKSVDDLGILVFFNGIVGNNTRRPLDREEFRGFVLTDSYAPLIFVNRNDTLTAQLFTLAHELVHLALGKESGVFNLPYFGVEGKDVEHYCNAVAAELLVPSSLFLKKWTHVDDIETLAKTFGVSKAVIARRALDLHLIKRNVFFDIYGKLQNEWEFLKEKNKNEKKKGGHFYHTTNVRLSRRFSRAVIDAADTGDLLQRDAYKLLGLNEHTFTEFAKKVKEGNND